MLTGNLNSTTNDIYMYNQLFFSISQKQKILTNFILSFSSGLIVPPGPICAITDLKVFSNYEKENKV